MRVRSVIEGYAIINNGMDDVVIGDHTHVTSRIKLVGPVTLGSYITLGSNMQVTELTHNYLDVIYPVTKRGITPSRTIVEGDVWISDNSCINQGITIGIHCIVAVGSVVTKSVPLYSIIGGDPVRVLRLYDFEKQE